jgi:hypothetical protein
VRPLAFNVRPVVSVKHLPTHARPGNTDTHSRDTSIPAKYGSLQRPRAVISSGHVHHVGRDACAHYFSRIYHIDHDAHDGRYNHDDHDYPNKVSPGYNGYNHT